MAIWYENMSSIISYLKKPIKLQLDTIRYPVELLKFKTIGEGLQGTQGDFEEWCIGSLSWLWWWFNDCIYIYVCVYKYIMPYIYTHTHIYIMHIKCLTHMIGII